MRLGPILAALVVLADSAPTPFGTVTAKVVDEVDCAAPDRWERWKEEAEYWRARAERLELDVNMYNRLWNSCVSSREAELKAGPWCKTKGPKR